MTVTGTINYMDRATVNPTTWYIPPPAGVPVDNVILDPREVEIADLRDIGHGLEPLRDGLAPVRLETNFTEFDDDEAVLRDLVPQMIAIAQGLFGRNKVFYFDHAVRRRPAVAPRPDELRKGGTVRAPLHRAHCDYTPASARAYLEQRLGEPARELAGHRVRIVNFWRPIVGPLRDDPLAICLPGSLSPDDLEPIHHIYADGAEADIYGLHWNPRHRWFTMSDMMPEDAYCFTLYDSGRPEAPVAPHTAFALRNAPEPIAPRASFEFRLAIYDDAPADLTKAH